MYNTVTVMWIKESVSHCEFISNTRKMVIIIITAFRVKNNFSEK